MSIVSSVGERLVDPNFPRGPYLTQTIHAFDEAEAAERAFLSARGVLDAVALIEPKVAERWREPVVGVESGSHISSHAVGRWRGTMEPLPVPVHALVEQDALGEACRYRVQAMQLRDPLARLSLLWLGLERLVAGSVEYADLPAALAELAPKALALRKIRSEVEALAQELERSQLVERDSESLDSLVGEDDQVGSVSRLRLLQLLQRGDQHAVQRLRSLFEHQDARLALWIERVRGHMVGPQPERVAQFFEATRRRISWQLMRLHRAHERIQTERWPLAWLRDLSLHAHHYLTAIIGAVMHVRQGDERRLLPVEMLSRRSGQYELFSGLVARGDRRALSCEALMDPLTLVGSQ